MVHIDRTIQKQIRDHQKNNRRVTSPTQKAFFFIPKAVLW